MPVNNNRCTDRLALGLRRPPFGTLACCSCAELDPLPVVVGARCTGSGSTPLWRCARCRWRTTAYLGTPLGAHGAPLGSTRLRFYRSTALWPVCSRPIRLSEDRCPQTDFAPGLTGSSALGRLRVGPERSDPNLRRRHATNSSGGPIPRALMRPYAVANQFRSRAGTTQDACVSRSEGPPLLMSCPRGHRSQRVR